MDFKVSRQDAVVKEIIRRTFPGYRGRKVRVQVSDRPMRLNAYWDGGSRSSYVAVEMDTLRTAAPDQAVQNPFRAAAHAEYQIPVGILLVEHQIFCGKDVGITIHVRTENVPNVRFLHPAGALPRVTA